jgi:hypothetical protein
MPNPISYRFLRLTSILFGSLSLRPVRNRPSLEDNAPTAEIVQTGLINCFDENLPDEKGAPLYCEASAVAFDGTYLLLGSDKPIPGDSLSAVFAIAYDSGDRRTQKVKYFAQPAFKSAVKYEDFTSTPDGKYFLATTAFDRFDNISTKLDGYNTLLCWKKGEEGGVKVVAATEREGVVSSVSLREKFSRALATPAFPSGARLFQNGRDSLHSGQPTAIRGKRMGREFQKVCIHGQNHCRVVSDQPG